MAILCLRGDFDSKIRKVVKSEQVSEFLNLLYAGNFEEEKDFIFYNEEDDVSIFATCFPSETKEDKKNTHYAIMASFKGKLTEDTADEVFDSNRLSEIVLIPRNMYITTKYPSNEANAIEINEAFDMKETFADFLF